MLLLIVDTASTTFELPRVSYKDLLYSSASVHHHLSTLGALVISGTPNFAEERSKALSYILAAGTEIEDGGRNSWGGVIENGRMGVLVGSDGESVDLDSELARNTMNLRLIVDNVGSLVGSSLKMDAFETAVRSGAGLEHFHSYSGGGSGGEGEGEDEGEGEGEATTTTVMDLHTDAGVFIVMTRGHTGKNDDNHILHIKLPSGQIVPTATHPDDIIVMVGESGGADFMYDDSDSDSVSKTNRLRPLPHKLVRTNNNNNIGRRSWYGRMYFPPKEVVDFDELYRDHRNLEAVGDDILPGCRTLLSQGLNVFGNDVPGVDCSTDDGSEGIFCWKACVSVVELDCGDGSSPVCYDTVDKKEVDGEASCPGDPMMTACQPMCHMAPSPTPPTPAPVNNFCSGLGTNMYMDGFNWVLFGEKSLCLNIYWHGWTLSNAWKFWIAFFGVVVLGMGVEWMGSYRKTLHKDLKKKTKVKRRQAYFVFLHFMHALMGYVLMLATMTYSFEMLVAVCLGLAIGYAVFSDMIPKKAEACCDFDFVDSSDDEEEGVVGKKGEEKSLINRAANKKDMYNQVQE